MTYSTYIPSTAMYIHVPRKPILCYMCPRSNPFRFVQEEFETIKSIAAKGVPFVVAENMILGTDHAEVGARILAHWNLPADVIRTVRWHHDPESADASDHQMDVVYLANLLCQTPETSGEAGGNAVELSSTVIDRLGIQMDQFEFISSKVARWVDELSGALAFN